MTAKSKSKFWNFVDNLEGDKVVWMVVLLLILTSILAVFSSTSLLAIETHTTRTGIMGEQILFSIVGLAVIIFVYNISNLKVFRFFSKLGFIISVLLLLVLASHIDLGIIKAQRINGAYRTLRIFGFQFHVFEFTKIAMTMYLAWAIDALKTESLPLAKLAKAFTKGKKLDFELDTYKKWIYIYCPVGIVTVLILLGSFSSAAFICIIMVFTIVIGGINIKDVLIPGFIMAAILGGTVYAGYTLSGGKMFERFPTWISRMHSDNYLEKLHQYSDDKNSIEFREVADKARQPISALIAIKEGKLTGKGAGNSTQRYVVPVMFGDYMFSFICEEYGLIGAIFIIALYLSLLARGSMIVRNCKTVYEKCAVAGLTLLITGQAFMHMMINVGLGPLTGQTLPIISHGTASFLMFCLAFGVILSFSKMAKKQMDKETKEILEAEGELGIRTYADVEDPNKESVDEVYESISDVENIEEQFEVE